MVLSYWGERVDEGRLVRQLETSDAGAFFFNLDRLRSWRLVVERVRGDLELLQLQLEAGRPLIVPVDTGLLPYWITRTDVAEAERVTDHAVVVVGIDEESVYVNDPDFETAPQRVEQAWFDEAWRNHEHWYAVIRRRWSWRSG
jgi:ABC-type bacteriocin/lantibiotic exporter with double-glycine peptidase domain